MNGEEWRVIPSCPAYEASSFGRIRRCLPGGKQARVGSIMTLTLPKGKTYLVVQLRHENKTIQRRVNRLVTEAFHGAPPHLTSQSSHGDGNPVNNRADNLRWDTPAGNLADREGHGTAPIGERNASAVLAGSQVMRLREMSAQGKSVTTLCRDFNMSRAQVKRIRNGKAWKHIPMPCA